MKHGNFALATCLIRFHLPENRSLKGKRAVVNRIKSRVSNRFNVSVAEVGNIDRKDSAWLAFSSVSPDKRYLEGQLDTMIDFIAGLTDAEMADIAKDIEIVGIEDDALF